MRIGNLDPTMCINNSIVVAHLHKLDLNIQ